jgi:sporadic carbohydrate cluster 2OG-Fe(II) oxygenase
VLLFNQNLAHGNVVNEEATTRWTMNCRFKQLLTPYADKRLGDFFEPITLRPSTRLGADYRFPDIGA